MTTGTTRRESCGECRGIELTETVEDYLKAVFTLTSHGEAASTSGIAARLAVAPPTVSAMLHRLCDGGLVERAGWGRVLLTGHGEDHARAVVRRHRLLETFLHRVLGVPWDELHEDAEVLEHHLSDRLEDLIDAALGFPERDPHGDPIPRASSHEEHGETPLAASEPGDEFLVQRVYDTDSAALRHLADLGIGPGVRLSVERRPSETGPMWVRVGERRSVLSCAVVNLIHGRVGSGAVGA
ncbi:metal-dependent transcriptional regulator [Nocardioides sp. zg-DK7169]|uniref:metal-dependent transcriptional regulator n=1 Tax=Nocardioides sp. zg-DK7169 TaxID=2736600 RepID=UPI0015522A19|nr:metal-dependent transcriptional regulator [Nocardioides sp. zg-DK7169]NPC97791.1 metal-dependent transcriptional regulator [Nocardioides sp. zg-DK7169]